MRKPRTEHLTTRTSKRQTRRRGNIALGLVITVTLGAATGVLVARSDTPASADTIAARPYDSRLDAVRWRPPVPSPPAPKEEEGRQKRAPRRNAARSCGDDGARLIRYRVSVQDGLDITKARFAEQVAKVLCDERSWIASGRVRFRYDPAGSTLISLRTAAETERRCMSLIGLSVRLMWSCASRAHGEAVLNADRWFQGSPSWPGSVGRYRQMLVNHEVGHLLGQHHRGCGAAGRRAPVMMQQSKGTQGCVPNPWPLDRELRAVR